MIEAVSDVSVFTHGGGWADFIRYSRIRDYFGELRPERAGSLGLRLMRRRT